MHFVNKKHENFLDRCIFLSYYSTEVIEMGFIENMNQRVKRFSILDLKLAQCGAILFALTIVKLVPRIMGVNIWWFIGLLILCAIKPFYVFYVKK